MIGESGAWALVCLYAGSSYLLDVGGTSASVSGLTFVSTSCRPPRRSWRSPSFTGLS